MAKNFADLPTDLLAFSDNLLGAVEKAVEFIAEAGATSLINSTPVDTSQAVSNWIVTHGARFTGQAPLLAPSSIKGSGASQARGAAKTRAILAIKGYTLMSPMYISNNTPYIETLNDGDSKHQASNMFAKGVQSMNIRAKQIRLIDLAQKGRP